MKQSPLPSPLSPACLASETMLISLNPQDEQVGALTRSSARATAHAIGRMRLCLDWARNHQVPIVHILTPPASTRGKLRPMHAIDALKPNAREPVLVKNGLSFFDSDELQRSHLLQNRRSLFLIGFTLAADCLAAALDANRNHRPLTLISDAIASFDLPPYSALEAEGVVFALLSQFATIISSEELFHVRQN